MPRPLHVHRSAANVTEIGLVPGPSYGTGSIIRHVEVDTMSRGDGTPTLCFPGLLHAMIEETLPILATGADLAGILRARLALSFALGKRPDDVRTTLRRTPRRRPS